jgi:hypothetical protein
MNVPATALVAPVHYQKMRAVRGAGPDGADIQPNVDLYRSSVPSMDEGWTRWVLTKQSLFRYRSVGDPEIRRGSIFDNYRTIILPDQSARTIFEGYQPGSMPPELTGGLGREGVQSLRRFVEEGGTVVCLNRASEFGIEQFRLPIKNVVRGVSEKEFFVPGSILRIELDTSHPIAAGMPQETVAWVEDSPVFEIDESKLRDGIRLEDVRVIARYPAIGNPLLSGWLLGEERLRNKAALVEVKVGKGRIILFGFRPQYRGQSLATYPLFFNSMR